ncbi:MAG: hypothetical protein JW852_07735 [Spirochaetales bacterium]|nr:hypothetical protein [Spirochaetales bacterium]
MPELPDLTVYRESLQRYLSGKRLTRIRVINPFVLRSVEPPVEAPEGKAVTGIERLGKRIIICLEDDLFLVFHLMIAGRLAWTAVETSPSRKTGLAVFIFENGQLLFTEAGTKRRASLHVVSGRENLKAFDRGGLELTGCSASDFSRALTSENHTLKRALTDPRLFSGIGNSYSDEILHSAKLSPLKLTSRLSAEEIRTLHAATVAVLAGWTERLRKETGDGFLKRVTAFREEMAVHGKYGKPCPVCSTPVQRIRYAENECNYCPVCQTGGKLLADRALSKLLKADWPRTVEELEQIRQSL